MKKVSCMLTALLIIAAFAGADIYIKSNVHTDAFAVMGQSQPASDTVSEQWIGDTAFAMISPDRSSVIDLKKNVMYMINHKAKTYLETSLPMDFAKLLPPEMASMASMMKMTVTVNPTGQTKTIGQWKCSGYDVTIQMMMMPMKMLVWATDNVPFDLKAYMDKVYGASLQAQMRLDEASVAEMKKIKGFWISSETSSEMMGAKFRSVTETVEIAKKSPPAGVYSVPAGYAKQDKFSMQDLQGK
ncbi:MAG: DUF4412 domain-containing protein [Acidobacteriota bacterium]|nr:DUF4412 domain-containing protein [Acidobacteriota bacterium]